MWFTNKPHSSIRYIKIQWLKKEVEQHYFELDGEKVEDSTFEGKLVRISPSEYEYEGTMRQTMKLLFVDSSAEYYQLDSSYNSISRWLLNTLLGYIDTMKWMGKTKGKVQLEMSLYLNKEWYKQMGIRINGERGQWRWSIDEQRSMIETIVKKNGAKENDYFEYDEKLKSCIPEIQNFIEVSDFIDEDKPQEIISDPIPEEPKTSLKETIKAKEEITIDDIPFR